MKIVYVIEKMSGIGGMERIITDKMNYLVRHTNHEVVMLLLWHDELPVAYPLDERVKIVRMDVPYLHKIKALFSFRKTIRKINPDITIYTWVMGAFLAAFSGWKGKCIYEAHRARPTMKHQWIMSLMERKVDAVVTLTQQDAKEYPHAKFVTLIPNFTSLHVEKPSDCSSKHCVSIGRLIEVKDFSRLLDIWKSVVEKHIDWHLDIVGEGPEREALQQKIERLGLSSNVTLHKATSDVLPFYLNSSIYLMTSRFEGLGIVLIEALTCGLPIVSFDCDYGPRHIIENDVTGKLIHYNDDEAMVNAICELIENQEKRQEMGRAALKASQKYQPENIMRKWEELWPLTRPSDTLSPGGEGKVCNEHSKEYLQREKVTSSSPLGERMPEGQVRGSFFLSLIIPVYRAEKYLDRCIESILMQGVDDLEIILVDDGSPDRSGEICDEWAKKDSRIRVIHKQNGGPGSARNMALDIAKGTYVTFIDSDDALAENTLLPIIKFLYSPQREKVTSSSSLGESMPVGQVRGSIDILEYPAHLYIGSPKERKLLFDDAIYDLSEEEAKKHFWLENKLYAHCYSCNKVFRRSLFDGIRYSESITLGEDIRLISQLLKRVRNYATINAGMYLYFFNGESISGSLKFADELLSSHIYAVEQLDIDIYSKASRYLYLTMLNFQIDAYRFAKTTPAEPVLRKNPIPLSCARNKKELIKILLLRIFGVKGICRLFK